MSREPLMERVRPWLETHLEIPLSALGPHPIPVITVPKQGPEPPPLAVKVGDNGAIVTTRTEWEVGFQQVVGDLHPDLLFSAFGCFELSRVTLPDGDAVWGPNWYLFGDESTFRPAADSRPVLLSASDLTGVDYKLFWHCRPNAVAGLGIYQDDRLVALATVVDRGEPVWEIGMEVVPDSKGRGLGRAVVSAAAQWILDNGRVILATVGPFNIPSARTLRSLGLQYSLVTLEGSVKHFFVPPQPLGSPIPGAKVYDYYPRWAMNQDILPKPDL